jgi:hypothetical protein
MQALIATLQCGAREFQGIVQQIADKLLGAYWVGECRDGTIGATKLKSNTFSSIAGRNASIAPLIWDFSGQFAPS